MFVLTIAFNKLFATYNNNITATSAAAETLYQYCTHTHMYINMIIVIAVMRLMEMLCKIIPNLSTFFVEANSLSTY